MKKVILFLSLFALLLSCAKDEGVGIENQPQPEESTYKVSVDQALKSLDIALANIDGETRSAKRSVKSIERVKASQVMDATRSADIPELEDLLYVVSFGEGQGSAVLGADKRVDEIFAILDQTVLTAEDLLPNNDTRSGGEQSQEEDLQDFLSDMIVDAAIIQVQDDDNIAPNNLITPILKHPTYRTEKVVDLRKEPILRTKWGQRHPYNSSCPVIDGDTCPAGCVAIAVGQILRYAQVPTNNTFGNDSYPWHIISKFDFDYEGSISQYSMNTIAGYIKKIGVLLRTEYSVGGSGTHLNNVYNLLDSLSLSPIHKTEWSHSELVTSINSNWAPVYIQGYRVEQSSNTLKGHAWVLDGLYSYTTNIYETQYNSFGVALPETLYFTESYDFVHCNFGYKGEHDGYYSHGIYNFNAIRENDLIEEDYGDVPMQRDRIYDRYFEIIKLNCVF